MSKVEANTALILIDWQEGFDDWDHWGGNRNNPEAEKNASLLLSHWRQNNLPVFHVIHHSTLSKSPLRKEKPSGQIIQLLAPLESETLMHKRENSAFVGTHLEVSLRRLNIQKLVISGLTTNHCVSTSTRMAGNLGFDVQLVGDACATFDRIGPDGQEFKAQLIHDVCLSDLHNEFCQVVNTADII
ncbi:cysteine hydrolase family protein [Curvivirga sp.]|uniref:cysteine hydrolase family protein n=1 Tax=Curvivirga sp. TaxID=2856848 RepID=UPI003B59A7D7